MVRILLFQINFKVLKTRELLIFYQITLIRGNKAINKNNAANYCTGLNTCKIIRSIIALTIVQPNKL